MHCQNSLWSVANENSNSSHSVPVVHFVSLAFGAQGTLVSAASSRDFVQQIRITVVSEMKKKRLNVSSLQNYWSTVDRKAKLAVLGLLIVNLPIALYTGLVHQVGALDVTNVLHLESKEMEMGKMSVLFLTPCCSTPFYSHVHADIPMRFLSCDPNLNGSNTNQKADLFYENPISWLDKEMPINRSERKTNRTNFLC